MLTVETVRPAPLDPRADQVLVPMRDRVCLATDVYLPGGRGPWPAVLVRLPYDKSGRYTFMPALAAHFTERGYAFVPQDVRGKFRSEGETMPFEHEVEDGYDTLDWLVRQRWSDGAVGMWGDSYYGFTQWAALASGHPALKAIVPRVTSADLAVRSWSGGSVPALYVADYLAHYWADRFIHEWDTDWSRRPLAELYDPAFERIGARPAGLDVLLAAAAGRGPGFDPYPAGHPFDGRAIPTLHCAGWYDNLAPDSMRDYLTLRSRPDRAALQYLVIDSTDHENYRLEDVPITPDRDHDTDDEALARMIPPYLAPALDFFDVFLKGKRPAGDVPAVRWHLGHVGWREGPSWPPPGARQLRLYLGAAGRAASGPCGGALLAAPEAAAKMTWVHDPADLVPSTVQDPFALLREYPDERDVELRGDVLSFTTEPFAEPLDLAGPVSLHLRVACSGPSMHLFAKLVDVAADGAAHMLTRGQALITAPDAAAVTVVDLNHCGYRLRPGHCLRLQLAGSDFPLYLAHPGTAEDPWFATRTTPNEQRLVTGGSAASHVRLTVLPAG